MDNFASKWDAPETSEPVKEHKEPELTPKHVGNPEKNGNSEKTKLISNDARDEERRRLLREVEVRRLSKNTYLILLYCLGQNCRVPG